MSAAKLTALRALDGLLKTLPQREVFSCAAFPTGLPKGAITEICGPLGSGKTEFVLNILAEHPEHRVAWLEQKLSIYPRSFPQSGVGMDRVLFVETGAELLWSTLQILRSGLFRFVVLAAEITNDVILKKLQIAAEQTGTALLLLAEEARRKGRWPVTLQISFERANGMNIIKGRA